MDPKIVDPLSIEEVKALDRIVDNNLEWDRELELEDEEIVYES